MKIARIAVRNFLGIRDFETKLEPGINTVQGANGSGKSSLLKAIKQVLRGGRADGPWIIHKLKDGRILDASELGEDARREADPTVAEILVELDGSYVVKREITKRGTNVEVTPRGAVPIKAPQSFLDSIVSPNTLNPVEFFNAPAAERRKILLSLVPPLLTREDLSALLSSYGLEALDVEGALGEVQKIGLEELRAIDEAVMVRRQAAWGKKEHHEEAAKAEAQKLPTGYDHERALPDFQDIMARLDRANATTAAVTTARHALQSITRERDRAKDDVVRVKQDTVLAMNRAEQQVERIKAEIARLTEALSQAEAQVGNEQRAGERGLELAMGELTALEIRVNTAQEILDGATASALDPLPIKDEAARYQEERTLRQAYAASVTHDEERKKYAAQVRSYDLANQEGIRVEAPKLLWSRLDHTPLKGLDLGMEGDRITVRGIDIDNLSASEQVRVSLQIARSSAGEVKTICIDGFEALDPTTRAAFREAAKDDGFQYVIAEVADGPLRVNGGVE